MDIKKLGQALISAKKLTTEKFKYALAMHEKIGGDFAPLLVKLGYVSDADITEIIGKLEGIPTVDIATLIIPKKLVEKIPRDVIEKHMVIPVSKKDDQIKLAMSDVNDYEAIEEIQFLTGCKVDPILASRDAIRKAIIQFYYGDEDFGDEPAEKPGDPFAKVEELLDEKTKTVTKALIALLIEKNLISQEELVDKVNDLVKSSEGQP